MKNNIATTSFRYAVGSLPLTLLALSIFAPSTATAQSCAQLFAKYEGSSWWAGAFGNCRTPGGTTDRAQIFECAWNQVPAPENTACLKEQLRGSASTKNSIDAVVAFNGAYCDQLFAKYEGSSWWAGAFGNCRKLGGTTDRAQIFECAWNQVPAAERVDCLRTKLFASTSTKKAIDAVVAFNGSLCAQLFAKYEGSSWWAGAFGNCRKYGGTTDRTQIFECAWNQVPAAEKVDCLSAQLLSSASTKKAIDAVIAFNNVPTCEQLFARYEGSSWWSGAFGKCMKAGGTVDRTQIFDCAWNQLPAPEKSVCLRDKLLQSASTKTGIDRVVQYNGKQVPPTVVANPYEVLLSPTFTNGNANTSWYTGVSILIPPAAKITSVKNLNAFPIIVSYKDSTNGNIVNDVPIPGTHSSNQFNGNPAAGNWAVVSPSERVNANGTAGW
jgi:hypothetical protein